mmetsp:Transcript_91314/g.263538  ORF Transcript_91314/g.263538 Transcript_91314/m.263538 type:complete len:236 (-) Transcript_91314:278-985(-)
MHNVPQRQGVQGALELGHRGGVRARQLSGRVGRCQRRIVRSLDRRIGQGLGAGQRPRHDRERHLVARDFGDRCAKRGVRQRVGGQRASEPGRRGPSLRRAEPRRGGPRSDERRWQRRAVVAVYRGVVGARADRREPPHAAAGGLHPCALGREVHGHPREHDDGERSRIAGHGLEGCRRRGSAFRSLAAFRNSQRCAGRARRCDRGVRCGAGAPCQGGRRRRDPRVRGVDVGAPRC